MTVEVVIPQKGSTTCKAPHWEEQSGSLLYVDLWSNEVHQYNPTTGQDSKVHIGAGAGFIVPRYNNGYIIGCGSNISYLDWNTKDPTSLAILDGGPKGYLGDAKCDPSGRLWTGTLATKKSLITFERDIITRKHQSGVSPAGFAWTHNTLVMYCSDLTTKKIYAFDCDIINGSISNQRLVFDYEAHGKDVPGGITIDQQEKLWIPCSGSGQIQRLDPGTGKIIQVINMPTKSPTSCCFGGINYDELYVTTGVTHPNEDSDALAGSIFKVTELETKGMPCPVFKG